MALARQPWALLEPLLEGVSADPAAAMQRLRSYARALFEWNRGVSNLVSHNDEPRLVERHLRESLAPARLLRESGCERFVDFGSGAGLPAVPLAVAGVGASWTCVESRRNKTLFIRKAKQELDLKHFEVLTGRLEMLIQEDAGALACDGFTSRATMMIAPTLVLAKDIVRPGGRAFLWKGSRYVEEMQADPELWTGDWEFEAAHEITDGANVCAVFRRK
ncbi:MAG: 16S rRNA (guanine(527)-N(7))-methyltransferase RsmG [Candidatus Eisenbacteria bacterium]